MSDTITVQAPSTPVVTVTRHGRVRHNLIVITPFGGDNHLVEIRLTIPNDDREIIPPEDIVVSMRAKLLDELSTKWLRLRGMMKDEG